jgi:hypothetical protein
MPERPQPQSPKNLSFFFAAAMLAAACRPALVPMEADDGRRRRRPGDHGGRGHGVEGAGSGRAYVHDSGHADEALGAPASRMPTTMMTAPMSMAMAPVMMAATHRARATLMGLLRG